MFATDALHSRIYQYPTSVIKQNNRKINYRDFLMTGEYDGCNEAVKRIVPRVNMDKIGAFIDEVPYLSELQRKFYKHYIKARYDLILVPAFDLAVNLEPGKTNPIIGI